MTLRAALLRAGLLTARHVLLERQKAGTRALLERELPAAQRLYAQMRKALGLAAKEYDPNQPRVPSGSEEGGEWTETGAGDPSKHRRSGFLPKILSGPTNFLVHLELENAKYPDLFYDGLTNIGFVEGRYWEGRSSIGVIEAYGVYNPDTRSILLASNAHSGNPLMERGGGGNIAVFGGATVLHEIGHHVHMAKLTKEAADEWAKLSDNGRNARISSYAMTNQGEHFAEAFRAYSRGGTYRKALKNLEPSVYKFMVALFRSTKYYLPYGEYASLEEFWNRYNPEHK